jgi:hypothetical protein
LHASCSLILRRKFLSFKFASSSGANKATVNVLD